jgi:hypothetical protein
MARSTVNPSSAASISCPAASASPAENPQAPVPRGQIIGLPATAATGKQQTANHACPQSRRNPRNTSSRPHLTGPAPSGMNDQSIARGIRLFQAVPGSGVIPVRAVPLAAFIPSRVPGRGHGAGSRQAVRRGQSRGRTRRQSAVAGQNDRRPRARPGGPAARSCCRGRCGRGWSGGPGQAADLPVAHPVEDQGQELAGGGDPGDVPGLFPAAGDDGVPGGADRAVPGDALDGRLDQRSSRDPCLVTCPGATLVSDSRCRGVSPAREHSCPGFLNRDRSPISAVMTAAGAGPMPGSCWMTW